MILVGLAAILIPAITDMVSRTSRSTASSNISEVSSAIQRYEAQYLAYPDNLDSLMEVLNGGSIAVLGSLNPALTTNTVLANVDLDQYTLKTLQNAGIRRVGRHADDAGTFVMTTTTVLAIGDRLQGLSTSAQVDLGLETSGTAAGGKYVLLGVGALSDMNGKTMVDAPVHFPRDSSTNPETVYSRFIAVFQITDGSTALDRAKFVGVIAPDGSGLSFEMNKYFEIAANF
jgi:type II secretory pathway pseudopilin PulG